MDRSIGPAWQVCVHAAAFGQVDVLLQLGGGAVQPVGVPGDDDGGGALVEVGEHLPVARALLAAVGGEVVVDVRLDDVPAVPVGEGLAVFALSVDAEMGAGAVLADAQVDDGARPAAFRPGGLHALSVPD